MVISNKVIKVLNKSMLSLEEDIWVSNSIINNLDFDTTDFKNSIIIENCIIERLGLHATWFTKGLLLRNNHIKGFVDYQMGGHNTLPIIIEGNIFYGFINFFDCQFDEHLTVKNNIFLSNTNLMGNQNEGFKNIFDNGITLEGNIGILDIDDALYRHSPNKILF